VSLTLTWVPYVAMGSHEWTAPPEEVRFPWGSRAVLTVRRCVSPHTVHRPNAVPSPCGYALVVAARLEER
jgi:hypothetical protein